MSTVTVSERARLSGWRAYVEDLWARREFAWYLAMGNLRSRNASTSLGLLWWVLNPLLMSMVYFVAFGLILRAGRGDPQFLAYLISGMFAFNYTSTAMTSGANSILANQKLLVNVRFPRLIFPITGLIETGVGFLVSLTIYYLIAWPVNGVVPSASIVWLPLAIAVQTAFNMGLAAWVARMAIPFRDINNLLPHVLRMWLYLSAVIWPVAFLDGLDNWAETIIRLNPMFAILSLYRTALMGRPLEENALVISVAWAVFVLIGGLLSFTRNEGNMVRYL